MAIHDFSLRGADVPPHVVEQAKRFIELNRDALLDYWDAKISTEDLLDAQPLPLFTQLRTYRCTASTVAMGQEETFSDRSDYPKATYRGGRLKIS